MEGLFFSLLNTNLIKIDKIKINIFTRLSNSKNLNIVDDKVYQFLKAVGQVIVPFSYYTCLESDWRTLVHMTKCQKR